VAILFLNIALTVKVVLLIIILDPVIFSRLVRAL
jgi:hypothetical protein